MTKLQREYYQAWIALDEAIMRDEDTFGSVTESRCQQAEVLLLQVEGKESCQHVLDVLRRDGFR